MDNDKVYTISQKNITLEDIVSVARHGRKVALSESSVKSIKNAEGIVKEWAKEGKVVYGMTTGLGDNIRMLVPPKFASELSSNIILSHSAGVGNSLPNDVVRAMMFIRAYTFAQGKSGITLTAVKLLVSMLNLDIYPIIPEQGSVGASGDLAPLAHLGLCVMGGGEVEYKGKIMKTSLAFKKTGLKPLIPTYKEGLSLMNGTAAMTAMGALLCYDSAILLKLAQAITAMGLEVLFASIKPFDEKGHLLKPHPGEISVAKNLRLLLKGSKLIRNDKEITDILEKEMSEDVSASETHRQEAYSLRCIPQMLGPVLDTLDFVTRTILTEANAIDDNPLVLSENDVFHGGHFHGQPVAMAMDYLCISLIEVGIVSERRTARMLDRSLNHDLPPFLASGKPGLSYGYQGSQFVATSLVAENRTLATPASIQSISTNAQFQDVVSMGLIAARKTLRVYKNTKYILALELMCAAQAAEYRKPENLSVASKKLYQILRKYVPKLEDDRSTANDFVKTSDMLNLDTLLIIEKTINSKLK